MIHLLSLQQKHIICFLRLETVHVEDHMLKNTAVGLGIPSAWHGPI